MASAISLVMMLLILFVAYLIIRIAVQHGIENSKTHELLQQIHAKMNHQEKKE